LLRVLNNAFDHPLKIEENAVMPLAGGIMQNGYQCGMLWGATLSAGAHAYRNCGNNIEAEMMAMKAAKKLVDTFQNMHGEINCYEITDINRSSSYLKMFYVFLIKGKTFGCFNMAAKYAKAAFNEINSIHCDQYTDTPSQPVSCTAELARKAGLSEMHIAMAAGLAGGIGLCGGACGALGAAIWIYGMKVLKRGGSNVDYNDTGALNLIDSFLKVNDYKFECAEIVGRKFENIDDHATFLSKSGCADNIDMLASQLASI